MVPNKAVLFVHFDRDEFCGTIFYPDWHAAFARAMVARQNGLQPPGVNGNFLSVVLPGTHSCPLVLAFASGRITRNPLVHAAWP